MIQFAIIGAGWRAEFYLRIAKALPEMFRVSAICVRNPNRASEISRKYSVKVVDSVSLLLQESFDFIVNCINKEDIAELSVKLADQGFYVLSETPVMKKPEPGHAYEKIQVAEQFHLKGMWQAIKKIIDAGIIGTISHINISVAHDYHAMSLMRFLLNDYEKPELIMEKNLKDTMLQTNGRTGMLSTKQTGETVQCMKLFQFQKASVLYDYNKEQYFSPIRKDRILIRGSRGEISDRVVRYFNGYEEPICSEIQMKSSGLLDGFYLDRISFENQVLYEYPEKEARLSEEEIAIAQCLFSMKKYIDSGIELYSYEKAYQDYLYFNL